MPTPELMAHLTGQYGPAILFTIAFFLAAEALVLVYARLRSRHRSINSRLHMLAQIDDRQAALEELRRYRGLSTQGHQSLIPHRGCPSTFFSSAGMISWRSFRKGLAFRARR